MITVVFIASEQESWTAQGFDDLPTAGDVIEFTEPDGKVMSFTVRNLPYRWRVVRDRLRCVFIKVTKP